VTLVALVGCSDSNGAPRATVGERAPTFVAPKLVGKGDVRLTEFRGKPVLVNFFASWCAPCRQELPLLQRTADAGQAAVVGVLFEDSPSAARDFLRDLDVTFATANDDGSIARAYRVGQKPGLPLTFAISADGTLVARHIGQLRPQDVPDLIRKASAT
jgi:thiol-disulfide isomerase/thioredoxin